MAKWLNGQMAKWWEFAIGARTRAELGWANIWLTLVGGAHSAPTAEAVEHRPCGIFAREKRRSRRSGQKIESIFRARIGRSTSNMCRRAAPRRLLGRRSSIATDRPKSELRADRRFYARNFIVNSQ